MSRQSVIIGSECLFGIAVGVSVGVSASLGSDPATRSVRAAYMPAILSGGTVGTNVRFPTTSELSYSIYSL